MATDRIADEVRETDTAGTWVRPPLLFLGALLLGFAMDHVVPMTFPIGRPGVGHWIGAYVAGGLIVLGLAVFVAAVRGFARAGTPVPGTRPTSALVTTGIHGWSRNPIYVGTLLVYVGVGLIVRSSWILILVLPVAVTMRYAVVALEEAYLEERFGDAYRAYKARVRRWV